MKQRQSAGMQAAWLGGPWLLLVYMAGVADKIAEIAHQGLPKFPETDEKNLCLDSHIS